MAESLVVLTYHYVPDIAERRTPFRERHLELLRAAHEAGDVVMGGAVGDPVSGALIVFRSTRAAEAFVADDPYGANGLVVRHRIQPWTLVIGA